MPLTLVEANRMVQAAIAKANVIPHEATIGPHYRTNAASWPDIASSI